MRLKMYYNLDMGNHFKAVQLLTCVILAGCGASPLLHVGNQVANFGQELPQNMVHRHVAGMVGFDEVWAGAYNRIARNALYVQGIVQGSPEYQLRVARVNLANTGSNVLWKAGELNFMGGAIVPDHLPRLKAGDVVEIRQTGTWRTMENFVAKQEGNIVVRVLCRADAADYQSCKDTGPKVGKYGGAGETHSEYPSSVRSYGFTFTPHYSQSGELVRAYP